LILRLFNNAVSTPEVIKSRKRQEDNHEWSEDKILEGGGHSLVQDIAPAFS
jgi:hypothetical protein